MNNNKKTPNKLYTGSIDLTKIDKTLIVSTDKNGQPFQNGAKYLNISLWLSEEADQYGNHISIQIGNSKETRKYIGNAKAYVPRDQQQSAPIPKDEPTDDLPF